MTYLTIPVPFFLAAIVATAAILPAQTVAWYPSDHNPVTTPNGAFSTTLFPYSYGVSRMMGVYDRWDLQVAPGQAITRIGFRCEGTTQSTGRSLQLEVRMGSTLNTAANCVANFDANYTAPPVTVFGPALFVMPDMNNLLNPNPDGNMIWLGLTTPFVPDPNQNLVVEWRVSANSGGSTQFSYALDRADFLAPTVDAQQVCPHSGGSTAQLRNRGGSVGSSWSLDLTQAPASQLAILFVSVGSQLQPPVPMSSLFPGTGASCTVDIPLLSLFSRTATTNTSGSFTWSVPLPNMRIPWNDTFLASQVVAFDFFAPAGVVVSNASQIQLGIDPAMTMIYSQGNVAAAIGSIQRNYGVVTAFEHQ